MKRKAIKSTFIAVFTAFLINSPANASKVIVPKIHTISYDNQLKSLTILSNGKILPELNYHIQNKKAVIDIPQSIFAPKYQEIKTFNQHYSNIRISQFTNHPPKVRIVYDLEQNIAFQLKNRRLNQKSFQLKIQPNIRLANQNTSAPSNFPEIRAPIPLTCNLKDIRTQNNNLQLVGSIQLDTQIKKSQYNKLMNEVTIFNCDSTISGPIAIEGTFFKNVFVQKVGENIVMSFQLKKAEIEVIPHQEKTTTSLQFLPSIAGPPIKQVSSTATKINSVEVRDLTQTRTYMSVQTNKSMDFQIYPLSNPDRIVIDTIGTSMSNATIGEKLVFSNLVSKVRFGTMTGDNENVRLVLDLKDSVTYQYNLSRDAKKLELVLTQRKTIAKARGRAFVVLDAGHGGTDPGAIGRGGTKEKDVVMGVTRYLERYLQNDRFKVALTRKDDREILLQPRVDVGNLRNADLFISIHANAMPKEKANEISGIETYYTTPQSIELARILHSSVVGELKAKDRGVRKRGLYVTRKANMPSVLLEIGFLTHPNEEQLLSNPGYQRRIAKAIYAGIHQYLILNEGKKDPLRL